MELNLWNLRCCGPIPATSPSWIWGRWQRCYISFLLSFCSGARLSELLQEMRAAAKSLSKVRKDSKGCKKTTGDTKRLKNSQRSGSTCLFDVHMYNLLGATSQLRTYPPGFGHRMSALLPDVCQGIKGFRKPKDLVSWGYTQTTHTHIYICTIWIYKCQNNVNVLCLPRDTKR